MLDSLKIKNFRCLTDFEVAKLGRLNLIVGKNNSGKSTVLEALRIYTGRAQRGLLEVIAAEHDEKYLISENEHKIFDTVMPFQDFFSGRKFPDDDERKIQIGSASADSEDVLTIQHRFYQFMDENRVNRESGNTFIQVSPQFKPVSKSEVSKLLASGLHIRPALNVSKGNKTYPPYFLDEIPKYSYDPDQPIPCSFIPTRFLSLDELADEWDRIVFTEHEEIVKQAMRIVAPEFENLTFVRNEDGRSGNRPGFLRNAKIKLANMPRPVPLNSLGDGMKTILQLALKIVPAKGGFLLIDEFENGLHYSIQEKVWTLLFEMALKLDIQVFATTHSWDCIESFSKVTAENKDNAGILLKMGKSAKASDRGRVIATVYDAAELQTITQVDMEIR